MRPLPLLQPPSGPLVRRRLAEQPLHGPRSWMACRAVGRLGDRARRRARRVQARRSVNLRRREAVTPGGPRSAQRAPAAERPHGVLI
eukprot:scaffold137_cov398-Prasinococcus_capsulatus_cf.AAC.71